MFRKPWVKRTLIAVLILIVLAVAGSAIYRAGYMRGALYAGDGIPMHTFGRFTFTDMDDDSAATLFQDRRNIMYQQFSPDRFPDSRTTALSGFVSPFALLFRLLFFVGFLWVLYKVFRAIFQGSGWQLTFSKTPDNTISPGGESNEQ